MDARDDYLHWNLRGHVLLSFLPLNSFSTLLTASLLTAIICSCERPVFDASVQSALIFLIDS